METYLGTWQTAPSDGFWNGQELLESERILSYAIERGFRGFDTAQSYGKGQAEQTLGKILGRHPSEPFLVDTKIMPSSKDPYDILKTSLIRLKTNHINRLYLHWPRSFFDNEAFVGKMSSLKDTGVVNKVGVCNMPLSMLETLISSGVRIDCYQRPVSLLWSRELDEVREFCRINSIELIGYSPLGMGLLSGRYRNRESLTDARKNLFCYDSVCHDVYLKLLDCMESISHERDVAMSDVALAWVGQSGCDVVLLGARSCAQLEANIKGLGFKLTKEQFEVLNGLSTELSVRSMRICDNIFSYSW